MPAHVRGAPALTAETWHSSSYPESGTGTTPVVARTAPELRPKDLGQERAKGAVLWVVGVQALEHSLDRNHHVGEGPSWIDRSPGTCLSASVLSDLGVTGTRPSTAPSNMRGRPCKLQGEPAKSGVVPL